MNGSSWSALTGAGSLLCARLLCQNLVPGLGAQMGNLLHENYRTDNFTIISLELSDVRNRLTFCPLVCISALNCVFS